MRQFCQVTPRFQSPEEVSEELWIRRLQAQSQPIPTHIESHRTTQNHTVSKRYVNFIFLAHSPSEFGIKRCKIPNFLKHFPRPFQSKRYQPLQTDYNKCMKSNSVLLRHERVLAQINCSACSAICP